MMMMNDEDKFNCKREFMAMMLENMEKFDYDDPMLLKKLSDSFDRTWKELRERKDGTD